MFKSNIPWITCLLLAPAAVAEITLAPLFQDGAVLQRDKPVPVWGHASAGKDVSVSFAEQTVTATADKAGYWQISLAPMPASAENRTLSVTESGLPALEVKDVMVGEVWLGSGQSNMQFPVGKTAPEDKAVAASGPVPLLRLFDVPRVLSHTRQETLQAKWTAATPETAGKFSAVAYFFGKKLAEELKVPVGMIHSSWGGSRIEPWWAEEGLPGIPELAKLQPLRLARSPGFPEYDKPFRDYVTEVGVWAEVAALAMDDGLPAPDMPKAPPLLKLGHNAETGTYQAMIHPLVPYALRGFLWYQGETNNGDGMLYTAKMKALIEGWRIQFRAKDAPFLYVQLAPYNYGSQRTYDLPGMWQAQQAALRIPHTGMAVTNDIGNLKDIHPTHKAEIGHRLALWALADTYDLPVIVKSGPLFSKFKASGSSITISFDHIGGGLATRDGNPPSWFEIAGADGIHHPAEAKISPDAKSIVLTSAKIRKPEQARFAWSQLAQPNLINREGLPAGAFSTHFPEAPAARN